MKHLKALLSTSSAAQTGSPLPKPSGRLCAPLSSVTRAIKSNFIDTLARKAKIEEHP
jgi:hypothetical protein